MLLIGHFTLLMSLIACSETPIRTTSSDGGPLNYPDTLSVAPFYTGTFDWPIDSARLSRGFRQRQAGVHRRPHLGIDLAAAYGTPIYAAQDGRVIYTGHEFRGFGRLIMIEGLHGFATFYAHLSKIKVHQGQIVKKGFLIGSMGKTGRATGVHLHFEIRKNRSPVDPMVYLPKSKVTMDRTAQDNTED